LADQGWLVRWQAPVVLGGRPGYVAPTPRAWAWAAAEFERESAGRPWAQLVRTMLPTWTRHPLTLPRDRVPSFLAHQREVNTLLLAWQRQDVTPIAWASSWDRPFPSILDDLVWPQPDYVLVLDTPTGAQLILGEHDRSHESLASFTRSKVDRYLALAASPDLAEAVLGFRTFTVWVSVCDPQRSRPDRRLARLAELARFQGGGDLFQFALAGVAASQPDPQVWCSAWEIPPLSEREEADEAIDHGDETEPTQHNGEGKENEGIPSL